VKYSVSETGHRAKSVKADEVEEEEELYSMRTLFKFE
jgi:hypothetical protein